MIDRLLAWASKRQARAATFAGWFQQFVSIGGAALTIPVVIGSLGNKEAGVWFSLQGIIAIFSLSDFGFSMAISRQVAYSFKSANNLTITFKDLFDIGTGWEGVGVLYAASRTIFFRVLIIALVLFAITYQAVIPLTNLLPDRTSETFWVWYLLAASFGLVFLTRLSQSFLDGLGYMYVGRLISGVYQILICLFSIAAVRMQFGLIGLAVGLLTASCFQFAAMQISLNRISDGRLISNHHDSRPLVRKLWKVSLPFGLVNTGGYLVGAVQIPLLGAMLGPRVVAPIYIALRISQALNATVLQVVIAQLPFFTQQCAQGHWLPAKRRMVQTLIFGGSLQAILAAMIFFASPILVDWWVGPGHYITGPVLLIFSINYAATCLASLPAQFVLASGRNPFAVSTLLHGAITLLGMLILCAQFGLVGAPLASLIAILLTNFWLSPFEAWKTWRKLFSPHNTVAT